MCSKQNIRKTAWCLLLVALISLIPSKTFRVFADSDIVPPFPYDELQTIGKNNYLLFKVHGVDQVDYVECIIPGRGIHGAFDSTLSGLSYSSLGGWVLQINAIDYCFKNGQKVDFDLQDIFTTSFMPVDNDDPYFSAWLEFVYTTTDVWGVDEDEISGYNVRFYKAQNFIIEPAATPTPTPCPVGYLTPFSDFPDTNLSGACFIVEVDSTTDKTRNLEVGSYYAIKAQLTQSPTFICYPYANNFFGNTFYGGIGVYNGLKFQKVFYSGTDWSYLDGSYEISWNVGYGTGNRFVWLLSDYPGNISSGTLAGTLHILATNKNYHMYTYPSDLPDPGPGSSTPVPTLAPTVIPQPSTTPQPVDPDKNSSWGWGIVNTLKYIFIPDKNKLIRLEKTTQTKFQQFGGGYDDLKHVSGFEDPVRPQNVVMNWKPFGTDSAEQQQQITLVDFEQIDFYLFQTSSGMFICDCLKASFTFLMFGYLIHVIRKHFVIENNTSEESDGGGD